MWWLIGMIVLALLSTLACCRVSGHCSRQEERKTERDHPCENCARWSECNGVDDECPWRAGNRG